MAQSQAQEESDPRPQRAKQAGQSTPQGLLRSVTKIRVAANRDAELTSDGGGTGRSDNNDKTNK